MARGDVVTFRNNPGQLALRQIPSDSRAAVEKNILSPPLIGRSPRLDSDTSKKRKEKKKSASQTVSPLKLSEE